jgi:thiol:disulfide interchange protein
MPVPAAIASRRAPAARRVLAALAALAGLTALAAAAQAKPWWLRGSDAGRDDFLPPDAAFRIAAATVGRHVQIHWDIAAGYYLYRAKIHVAAASPDLLVGPVRLPPGVARSDRYFGVQDVYYGQVDADVAFTRLDFGAHPLQLKVSYQGCAAAGLCYPPIVKVIFPAAPPTASVASPTPLWAPWEGIAIGAGAAAFLIAGLRGVRRRPLPPPDA